MRIHVATGWFPRPPPFFSSQSSVPKAGHWPSVAGIPPLGVAVDAILQHLPLVEEAKIDLLIHDIDYWNWGLPATWWEGIRDWLDGPVFPLPKGQSKRID
ncbi:hypothetical protein DPSP01_003088 [Paraphaeosphaeria sporulosa]